MIASSKMVTEDKQSRREIRVVRDHFRRGSELSLVRSGISELKAFDGADRQADDCGPHVGRPILLECRLVDQGSLSAVRQLSSASHDDGLAVCGGSAPIDIEADLTARGIVHDVVVVGQPHQDLVLGDRVRDHNRAMSAARLVSQPALMMTAEPGFALVRR